MNLYYVQADGDTFLRHIHDVEPTQWADGNLCRVANLTPDQIARFGIHQLRLVTPPPFDPATQKRVNGPALLVDGVWTQNWVVSALTAEEIEEIKANQWVDVRNERNAKLAVCDWTQLSDAPVSNVQAQQWATYRQALRDITLQPDPFAIEWPAEPM